MTTEPVMVRLPSPYVRIIEDIAVLRGSNVSAVTRSLVLDGLRPLDEHGHPVVEPASAA